MRNIPSFESFLNEGFKIENSINQGTKLVVKFELSFGKIKTPIYFFVGPDSTASYDIFGKKNRDSVEKYVGIPYADLEAHVKKMNGDESMDAAVASVVNVASTDHIYSWINGTRIAQKCKEIGNDAMLGQSLADVCFQLANLVICKEYKSTKDLDWLSDDGLNKEWEDYTNGEKKGMIPIADLQMLTTYLVEKLTPIYKQYMEKYLVKSHLYIKKS
ncbi:hypothetical protein EBU94_00870 [bacterium]|nr:hypothetical protein [bacterium]